MEFVDLKTQYQEMRESINGRIQTVLDHGQYIMGPEVRELEDKLSAYTGARHCITVASGTEALLISLMAIGIKPGDEVITTSFSFIATAEVIVLLGAKPVFVDIESDTCNINVSLIEAKITNKTKAIMPVSLYGLPADMDAINIVADKYGLVVIEDAAQSFGATYKGKRSCNLSAIGCTSFFPSKPLGCYGDGGAIFTKDDSLAQIMREIRVHGQSKRYVHTRVGLGGRMDTLQCAIVLAKLEIFEDEIVRRKQIAEFYLKAFEGHLELPIIFNDRSSVFAQFTLYIKNRELIIDKLTKLGIPSIVHYPIPIPSQLAYSQYACDENYPIATKRSKEVLSLPISPYLLRDDQDKVAKSLLSLIEQ